jgi:phospholipid transport system substrate-binding protein
MMRRTCLAAVLLCALVSSVPVTAQAATGTVDTTGPAELIRTASEVMLKDLETNRSAYRKDPAQLYKLVDDVLLPNFDVNFAAQQVLGKYWRTADATQRERFVKAFYRSLLHTYGDALIDFTTERIRFLPYQGEAGATRATVRTEIRRDGGSSIKVNYSLRKTEAGWKAWDVVIEGISYVKSFQEDFTAELDTKGLDSLIQRLESAGGAAVRPARRG